jgi:hypothetical protein
MNTTRASRRTHRESVLSDHVRGLRESVSQRRLIGFRRGIAS